MAIRSLGRCDHARTLDVPYHGAASIWLACLIVVEFSPEAKDLRLAPTESPVNRAGSVLAKGMDRVASERS